MKYIAENGQIVEVVKDYGNEFVLVRWPNGNITSYEWWFLKKVTD